MADGNGQTAVPTMRPASFLRNQPAQPRQPQQPPPNGASQIQLGVRDPQTNKIDWVLPNFGRYPVSHVTSFQSMLTSAARVYRQYDEAVKHSLDNARYMRNDCGIMECVEARQRCVSLLNWHLEPEDDKSHAQKELCGELTKILQRIRRFPEYRVNLLHAIWYGRYGIQHQYGWQNVGGHMRLLPTPRKVGDMGWSPVHGDKLCFRFDDGSLQEGQHDGQVGIRVGTTYVSAKLLHDRSKVEVTDRGMAYFLDEDERKLLAIHKHMIEDGEFEDAISAGKIHGVGIRSRIYWEWVQKQETLGFLMEYLERCAGGIQLWKYPSGNAKAKQEVETAAQTYDGGSRNVVTVPIPMGDESGQYGVEIIEPGMAGIDMLKDLVDNHFGHRIKRYILGQVLSSEAESTGLGSGVAEAHMDTLMQIIRYDAANLEETITFELLNWIKEWNFPEARNIHVAFRIDTESEDAKEKLEAFQIAYQMGCKLRSQDVMDLIGAAIPGPDDEVLSQQQQQQEQAMMGMPPGGPQGIGAGGVHGGGMPKFGGPEDRGGQPPHRGPSGDDGDDGTDPRMPPPPDRGGGSEQYAKLKPAKGQKSFDEHWVTIGGEPDDKGHHHAGGTPVKIEKSTGKIVAGPDALEGKTVGELKGGESEKKKPRELFDDHLTEKPKQNPRANLVTADKHPGNGNIITDESGKEWLVMKARHGFVEGAPIENGKAIVNANSIHQFYVGNNIADKEPDKLYETGRNYYEEQERAKRPAETSPIGKPQSAYKKFLAEGGKVEDWNEFANRHNEKYREDALKKTAERWASGDEFGGNDIANKLRSKGVDIPQGIAGRLQHEDTSVSLTSASGAGMKRPEAAKIHKWVSEQMGIHFPWNGDKNQSEDSAEADEPSGWSPENHLKIAADSIDKLRGQDVYRLLDSAPPEYQQSMAGYIRKHRPDLSGDVHDAEIDIAEERGQGQATEPETDAATNPAENAQETPVSTPGVGNQPVTEPRGDVKSKVMDHLLSGKNMSLRELQQAVSGKGGHDPDNPLSHPVNAALKELRDSGAISVHEPRRGEPSFWMTDDQIAAHKSNGNTDAAAEGGEQALAGTAGSPPEDASGVGESRPEPEEPKTPHALFDDAQESGATPREAADAASKAADPDYEFARQSAVPNAGEDLKNSARHKVNAWRGLQEAESDGTAEAMVTRDNLLKAEPHGLMSHADKNPLTALSMHNALKAFPARPGYGNEKRLSRRSPDEVKKDRAQYLDAYREIKAKAEELAANQTNPKDAMNDLREFVLKKVKDLRASKIPVGDAGASLPDQYNNTANSLIDLYNKLSGSAWEAKKSTNLHGKLNEFVGKLAEKYGTEDMAQVYEKAKAHAKDLIEGRSLPATFGESQTGQKRPKDFDPAAEYVAHAVRKGGPNLGQDVATPQKATKYMTDKLGMRGVQWGNSVTDDEREHHARMSAEAFADLADILGLPPSAVSLGGKLGLAIGARGHGTAMAHYEPGSVVINLTRKNGVGTLAHEWGHGFDHLLGGFKVGRGADGKMGATYKSADISPQRFDYDPVSGVKLDENKRPIMIDNSKEPIWAAMNGVRQAMRDSGFDKRLGETIRKMVDDGDMSKNKREYWKSHHEKFARSFERYVQHKLQSSGRENTYLSGLAEKGVNSGEPHPLWPNHAEIAAMAPAFDALFEAYKTQAGHGPQKYSRSELVGHFLNEIRRETAAEMFDRLVTA